MIFDGYIYGKWGYFYVRIEKSVGVTLMVGGDYDNENLLLLLWERGQGENAVCKKVTYSDVMFEFCPQYVL